MDPKLVALDTAQLPRGLSKRQLSSNMNEKLDTLETSQERRWQLNRPALRNMFANEVAEETSHPPISALKDQELSKKPLASASS
mmetsp:Transcript_37131/g.86601  ORF Transcript_37131/g.86601 Transcript_37131/m.86601 type:complete len:84 (-) Transcript_37131:155-406(-)